MEQFDIAAFRDGDIEAFNVIYRAYYRAICFFSLGIIKQQAEAEDIASEAMIKLWKAKGGFTSEAAIRSFLYVTAKNTCIDYVRAQRRHEISHREVLYLSEETHPAMEEEIEWTEILRQIHEEIDSLPPRCRHIFKLLFIEKKSTAQVAEATGLKTQTILNQKNRALQLLRTALLKKGL